MSRSYSFLSLNEYYISILNHLMTVIYLIYVKFKLSLLVFIDKTDKYYINH